MEENQNIFGNGRQPNRFWKCSFFFLTEDNFNIFVNKTEDNIVREMFNTAKRIFNISNIDILLQLFRTKMLQQSTFEMYHLFTAVESDNWPSSLSTCHVLYSRIVTPHV